MALDLNVRRVLKYDLEGEPVYEVWGWTTESKTWLYVAVVVDLAEVPGDKGRTLYAPVYRYWAGNAERTATATVASRPARYKVGDDIQVLVDPLNAADSELLDGTTALFTWVLMAVGLFVLAIGFLVLWLVVTGQMQTR